MSEAFTPAPWGILASSKKHGTQVRASNGDGTFTTICYALNGDADGRLIAAAPFMLEALLLMRDHPMCPVQVGVIGDAAIRKARGGQ